jgi:hypothetical protein
MKSNIHRSKKGYEEIDHHAVSVIEEGESSLRESSSGKELQFIKTFQY